jgi:ribosomal protein L7/L12
MMLQKLDEISCSIRVLKNEIVNDLVKNNISWKKLARYDKIEAIKLYRSQTGCTLMEAKNCVDYYLQTGEEFSKE